jgi:hypothetical protein
MDVFHWVSPTRAVVFKRPQPSSKERCWARMRFAVVLGIVTKHHPAGPSYFQSFARKEKPVSMDFVFLVVFVILVTGLD